MVKPKPATIPEYLRTLPPEARRKVKEIRSILKKVSPKAKELLKWGNPVFEENRILYAYSAHRSHLNFMPTRRALDHFRDELSDYKTGKDTIQFPYDKPLPKTLIKKIAAFRARDVRENDARWM